MEPNRKIASRKGFFAAVTHALKRTMAPLIKTALLAGSLASATPCSGDGGTVRSEMLVTTSWLNHHLKDPNLVVLCFAASPSFYSEGHIPGARSIKLADIAIKRGDVPNELPSEAQLVKIFSAAGVTEKSRIVLYGDRYNLLAARAYYTLDYLGLAKNAALLDGGLDKWKSEMRPLSKDVPMPHSGALRAHLNQSILVDTPTVRKITPSTNGKSPILLDARPREEFTGARHSEEVHKLGHIPGAKNLYWQDLLVSRENPILLPVADLRRRFNEAGAVQSAALITYAAPGCSRHLITSSQNILAMTCGCMTHHFSNGARKTCRQNVLSRPKASDKLKTAI